MSRRQRRCASVLFCISEENEESDDLKCVEKAEKADEPDANATLPPAEVEWKEEGA